MKKSLLLLFILLLAACGGAEPTDEPADAKTAVTPNIPTEEAEVADTEETSDLDHGHDHDDLDDDHTHTDGLDIDLFYEDALEEATIQDCTLSDGTETTCYAITIAGYPADYDVGPFCPPTIESTAEEGGIWFDGNAVYDIDGEFILGLADLYNDDNWKLYDDDGNVNITETAEEFEAAARPDVDPDLQNHCVEGRIEWLENGEPVPTTVLIPTTPVMGDDVTSGGNWGVTLDGVIIAAHAPVDAILSAYTIAAFDDCGGHINPFDGYHLHGAVGCSEVGEASEGETPIFAYALDGYPIHSPLEAEVEAAAELDECNGHTTEEFGYHYHANPAEENGVLTCFMGLTVQAQDDGQGAPAEGNGEPPQGGQPGGVPDFAAAAAALGVSEDDLLNALGDPPPDFEAAAATLGVTVEALQEALLGGGAPDGAAPPDTPAEAPASVDIGNGRLFTIPGDNVFPEGVSFDEKTGKFYVGSTSDGTLYVGDVNGDLEMTVFSEGGADGRTAAVGTKVDDEGRLWVAGGGTGQVFVYDTADGSHVATITTPASDGTFINDLAITDSGVYFTDSFRPILWRVTDIDQGEAEAWLDFTGTAINYVEGFNLNGIVPTEGGNTLIVVHSGEGALYRIDVDIQEVTQIDTGTTELTAGDGLALIDNTIYVTRNSFGEIVPLELSADLSTATSETAINSDLFGYPTTIAYTGNSFLVANSQFNNRGAPNLPFTVAQIPLPQGEATETMETETFQLEAWADNWFAAYLGEELIIEDSVSITTERSFNAETAVFNASYPLTLNFILKDFKENDTGLEYIGANNQQMGDGGFIMQLTDVSTGDVVAVSNAEWACTVIHEAPLDKSCENEANPVAGVAPCEFTDLAEPDGWKTADFEDSSWTATTIYSGTDVSPKDGYDQINWDAGAELIWGPDLETDNTILCRVMVDAP